MFTAGPSTTETSSAWHSSPMASPMLLIRSLSKELATAQAAGKHTATMESFTPRWSPSLSCFLRP